MITLLHEAVSFKSFIMLLWRIGLTYIKGIYLKTSCGKQGGGCKEGYKEEWEKREDQTWNTLCFVYKSVAAC